MAFNKHYIIPFKSFRGETDYRLCIWDQTGAEQVELIPAAEPFVTQEDDDEDAFAFIRTQTGSIRVVDTGDVNWRSIMPSNDLEKPVTLEVMNSPVWVGYLQSESYGGELYGNPQEREFAVQCPLSVLRAVQVTTEETELHNFAYILKYIIDSMPSYTNNANDPVVNRVIVQGGTYARQWLLNLVDWQNFINQSDEDGDTAKYNLYEILEDICRFWGWTARILQRTLYLTRNDDSQNSGLLTLTYSQLTSLSNGSTSAGSTSSRQSAIQISSGSLVSTDNDDFQLRGPSKATVKSDCNAESTVVKFAPKAVREELGDTWTWVQGEEFMTGYFTTPNVRSFGQSSSSPAYNIMRGTSADISGGFFGFYCRRQIFSSSEADKADKVDMICTKGYDFSSPLASISIERWRNYSGGSLSLKGSLYAGERMFTPDLESTLCMFVRIGIGSSRSNAKWYSLQHSSGGTITSRWQSTPDVVAMPVSGSQLQGFTAVNIPSSVQFSTWGQFQSIPLDENLSGKLFIDFMGMAYGPMTTLGGTVEVQMGDFEVEYSRDVTFIPSTTDEKRARVMTDERKSSREYVSESDGQTHDEWNADCIYASDNNMEYGYGLLQLPAGGFMEKATYYTGSEYPEKHLANRVVAYWQQAKRKLSVEVTQAAAAVVTPVTIVVMDDTQCQVLSIAHNWCDDVVTLGLLGL